jgi:hypothetical protein
MIRSHDQQPPVIPHQRPGPPLQPPFSHSLRMPNPNLGQLPQPLPELSPLIPPLTPTRIPHNSIHTGQTFTSHLISRRVNSLDLPTPTTSCAHGSTDCPHGSSDGFRSSASVPADGSSQLLISTRPLAGSGGLTTCTAVRSTNRSCSRLTGQPRSTLIRQPGRVITRQPIRLARHGPSRLATYAIVDVVDIAR